VCGRFVQASPPGLLAAHFDVDEVVDDAEGPPSYNVAPRAAVLTIVQQDGVRRLDRMRWGLVPSWAPDLAVGDRMINARAESVLGKPAFRAAFERRRCIVPADGFYEWKATGAARQPMFLHRRDGTPLALAGIWEVWRDPDDVDAAPVRTCSIITTTANAVVAPVHDRMPVVLDRVEWSTWLAREIDDVAPLVTMLDPAPDAWLETWPVSPRVNKAEHDDPGLVDREDPLTLFG
jgi:putative SOS response-associated peptidase YedK